MRIISKFSDYYDSIQSFDKDDLVYLRKSNHLYHDKAIKGLNLVDDYSESSIHQLPFKKMVILGFRMMILGFCGKLFPLIEIHYLEKKAASISKTINMAQFYSQTELNTFFEDMLMKIPKRGTYSNMLTLYQSYFRKWEERLSEKRNKLNEIFVKQHVPIFLIRKNPEVKNWDEKMPGQSKYNEVIIVTNPCLKDLSFQKIFDPYLAFQEISMFLGGVLARPDRPMLTVADEVKIQQHGFDQYSFRTMKGDKKPRKSNRGKKP